MTTTLKSILLKSLFALAFVATAACSDGRKDPDEKPGDDEQETPVDVPQAEAVLVQLSKTGHDGFFAAAYDGEGRLVAAGFSAEGVDAKSDRAMTIARFTKAGDLDATFGENGIAKKNVRLGGNGETARGLVIQSSGKIVVGGTVEAEANPADRDIALVRFNTDGSLDSSFGTEGVVLLDFNTGHVNADGKVVAADNLWNLALSGDKIVVHGNQRAEGDKTDGTPRDDTDWVLVRLLENGEVDTSFGTAGKFTLDIDEVGGNARRALVLRDGSIIGSGYAKTPSLGKTQPVVYKVDPTGKLDAAFGVDGVFHDIVLPEATEVYALALQGDKLVTTGYGRANATDDLDFVSLRLHANGTLDETWGTQGAVRIDWAGFADKSRQIAALDDGRFVLVGGASIDASTLDAMVAVLTADGALDASSFDGKGKAVWDLGGKDDMFWDVAVSPVDGTVAIVGGKVTGEGADAGNNDDAAVLFLKLAK